MYAILLIKVLSNQENQENLVHHVSKLRLHKMPSGFCNFSFKKSTQGYAPS